MKFAEKKFNEWATRPLFTVCDGSQTPALQHPETNPKACFERLCPDLDARQKLQAWLTAPLLFLDVKQPATTPVRA